MRRFLLLALGMGLMLPTSVNAGDLGGADLPTIEEAYSSSEKYQKKKSESISNEFNVGCQPGEKYVQFRKIKCKVVFNNGRLTVDNSIGIKPSQVISIIGQEHYNQWRIVISYIDSKNRYSNASFYPLANAGNMKLIMYPFMTRLIEWKNTGK